MQIAARSAPRSVGDERPTRLRTTPSHPTPKPIPVTAAPAKKRTGIRAATARTVRTSPPSIETPPTTIALGGGHDAAATIETAPTPARRAIAIPPRTRLEDPASCKTRLGPSDR